MSRTSQASSITGLALLLAVACLPGCGIDAGSGAAGPALIETSAPLEQPELGDFDAARAFAHLEAQVRLGPRPAGSPGAELARQHIESTLRGLGLEPRRETFTARPPRSTQLDEVELANIIVELPPDPATADESTPWVIVATHYDTKRNAFGSGITGDVLGANDGASGVALLLELAQLLKSSPARPVGYRLVFLDGEEAFRWRWVDPDNRYGSRHHATNIVKAGDRERFAAMILVDMVADRELDLVHDLNSDAWLRDLFFETARELGHGDKVGRERLVVADDHLSFRAIGIPVVDLIDLNYPDETNRFWHSDEDTLENVSAISLGTVGEIVVESLPALERRLLQRR